MTLSDFIFSLLFLSIAALLIDRWIRRKKEFKERKDDRIMSLVPGDGHLIWELNFSTLEMSEVDAVLKEDGTKEIITKDGCLYCTALNEKNAIKHFNRMVPGKFEKLKE